MSLQIVRAVYGPSDAETSAPYRVRFVHDKLQSLVVKYGETEEDPTLRGERLLLTAAYNGVFGDPSPDEPKILRITYRVNGGDLQRRVWPENSHVLLDAPFKSFVQRQHTNTRVPRTQNTNVIDLDEDVFGVILGFLPYAPDQFRVLLTCKAWKRSVERKRPDSFKVGEPTIGHNYLHASVDFISFMLRRSAVNMVHLDLCYYKNLSDEVLCEPLQAMQKLRVLRLNGCELLTDLSILTIARYNRNLIHLEVKSLKNITDVAMVQLLSNCPDLNHVNLSDCRKLTDATGLALANLRSLNVVFLKDVHLLEDEAIKTLIAQNADSLQVFSLWGLHRLTSVCAQAFNNQVHSSLVSLNLWGCNRLQNDAVVSICKSCPNLVELNLRFCYLLTDESMLHVSSLPMLEHLDVYYLRRLTDIGVVHLTKSTKLRSLNVSQCPKLTGDGLIVLCKALDKLTELSLMGNSWVNDDFLEKLAAIYETPGEVQSLEPAAMESDQLNNLVYSGLDLIDLRNCRGVTSKATEIISTISALLVAAIPGCFCK